MAASSHALRLPKDRGTMGAQFGTGDLGVYRAGTRTTGMSQSFTLGTTTSLASPPSHRESIVGSLQYLISARALVDTSRLLESFSAISAVR